MEDRGEAETSVIQFANSLCYHLNRVFLCIYTDSQTPMAMRRTDLTPINSESLNSLQLSYKDADTDSLSQSSLDLETVLLTLNMHW